MDDQAGKEFDLQSSSNPKQPRCDDHRSNNREAETHNETEVAVELRLLRSAVQEHVANQQARQEDQREQSDINKRRFRIEKATLFLATVGAVISITALIFVKYSADAARDAARAAQASVQIVGDNFVNDQQPYVLIGDIEAETPVRVGEKSIWKVPFRNYGKSPAVNFRGRGKVLIGRDTKVLATKFLEGLPQRLSESTRGPLAPTNTDDFSYTSISTDGPLTPEERAIVNEIDFGLIVVGRFEYEDLIGNVYRSDFCAGTLQTGRIAHCPGFNAIGRLAGSK